MLPATKSFPLVVEVKRFLGANLHNDSVAIWKPLVAAS
jgi:hypothetical protein